MIVQSGLVPQTTAGSPVLVNYGHRGVFDVLIAVSIQIIIRHIGLWKHFRSIVGVHPIHKIIYLQRILAQLYVLAAAPSFKFGLDGLRFIVFTKAHL